MPKILRREQAYKGYSTIERITVRLDNGVELTREVESHGRAVAVLPYDPERRVALLVRQFRAPVMLASNASSLLEAPAGMIEEDESAEDSVRREAMEEVGLKLRNLERVALAWPSSGVSTESMALYLAEYCVADQLGVGGGLDAEQEHITVVETPLAELAHLGAGDEAIDMKLMLLVQTLRLRRPQLFA